VKVVERLSATVVAALERDGTIVTADPRQAYQIRAAWAERQRSTGRSSWTTPDVLPLEAMVARAWHRALVDGEDELPSLLGAHQERVLWEQIVRGGGGDPQSASGERFLQPHGTARAAMRAWRRARHWNIDLRSLHGPVSDEAALFRDWARAFEERCRARHWIDVASGAARMPLPARSAPWIFTGFDAPTASVLALAERLRAHRVDTTLCSGPAVCARISRTTFADAQAEWRAAASWAGARLLAAPQSRLHVVVPDLDRARDRIERVFDEILQPIALGSGPRPAAPPFAIEGGVPLARYPMVASALAAVAIAVEPQPFEAVSAWYRSPHLADAPARGAERARLDCELRARAAHELDMSALAGALARAARRLGIEETLSESLGAFQRALSGRHGVAHWSALLSEALRTIGWPGPGERDSAEQQTLEKFNDALAELARLDDIVGPVDARGMLRHLRALAEQTRFQPQTGAAPVSLSGRLVDPALALDGLWVCGLHAQAWPRAPRPDPFLPWEMQAAAGIPQATAAGMLALARGVTARWAASAAEVVFSRPLRIDDEDCLPSPLILEYPQTTELAPAIRTQVSHWRTQRDSARREELEDTMGPPLDAGASLRGGAYTVTLQSLCPIRAFAARRLGADRLERPQPGFDARTRGTLMHETLAILWARLETRERLAALGESERGALIAAAVSQAIAAQVERAPRWPQPLIDLERRRLAALVAEWLAVEIARPSFTVVARELEVAANVGTHPVQLRIDRVDRVADGRLLVLDYKTGVQTPAASLGERPENAQLPLYAVACQPEPSGAAIAQVRPGDCTLKGESSAPDMAPGIGTADWRSRMSEWRATLDRLVRAFAAGDARVDPRTSATCDACHLHGFCRIDELRTGPVTDVELADGD